MSRSIYLALVAAGVLSACATVCDPSDALCRQEKLARQHKAAAAMMAVSSGYAAQQNQSSQAYQQQANQINAQQPFKATCQYEPSTRITRCN